MARVELTRALRRHVDFRGADVEGSSVREVLDNLFGEQPALRPYVLDDQARLRPPAAHLRDAPRRVRGRPILPVSSATWLLAFLALLAAAPAAASEPALGPTHVLRPGAERVLERMLRPADPLADGSVLSAAIDKDRVAISAGPTGARTLEITLLRGDGVGSVSVELTPGPSPDALVAEIRKRIEASGAALTWEEVVEGELVGVPKPPPTSEPRGASLRSLRAQLARVDHDWTLGDRGAAIAGLEALPSELELHAAWEVALRWRHLGESERARATLPPLSADADPPTRAVYRVLLEGEADVEAELGEHACGLVAAARLLAALGQREDAVRWMARVREADPKCKDAWETQLGELVAIGRLDEAVEVGERALGRFGDDEQILGVVGAVHQARGDIRSAVEHLEKAARMHPEDGGGHLAVLLSLMTRNEEHRAFFKARLEASLAKDRQDTISRFLLGVLAHYDNEFTRSNELLGDLEPKLGSEDRFHIYRAMNDFNLGDRVSALARLEARTSGPSPDSDVYYCLAEIQRDTAREAAKRYLEHYAAITGGDRLNNPAKTKRIAGLLELLDDCLADGREECEGDWEHPRLRERDGGSLEQALAPALISLMLLVVLALVLHARFRRRRD